MTRVLIVAHAPLASALFEVGQHTFPELASRMAPFDVAARMPAEEIEAGLRTLVAAAADDEEVLILTDVFGASPANVAQRVADGQRIRVLAGVNVPMLWRALNYAMLPIDELINRAMIGGAQGVMPIASTRPQNQALQPSHDPNQYHHQQ